MGYFLKYFSLIKLLTRKRVINVIGVRFSHFTKKTSKIIQLHSPYNLSIELSSICNLNCPQCPVGLGQINRKKKFMELTTAKKVVSEFAPNGIVLNLYFQGESMLHPDFYEIAALGKANNLFTVLSTNATLINEENAERIINTGIHRIIISADGIEQNTYEKYRIGGQADIVWNSIELLTKAKKKVHKKWPEIVVQTLVSKHNENSLSEIKKHASQKGADKVHFKTMQLYQNHDAWLPSNKKFRRYQSKNMIKTPKNKCLRALSGVVVSSDGEVLPCCQDKQAKNSFGNVADGFLTVVKGEKRSVFLNSIYFSNKKYSICRNCPEAMKVYKKAKKRRIK
jgi:radical SAM protein with 4Fe4S-binding SPASM domain